MPIYFTGQTGPALPLNSLQFNNAGAFGGDANLTWVPASGLGALGILKVGNASLDPYNGGALNLSTTLFASTGMVVSTAGIQAFGTRNNFTLDPPSASSTAFHAMVSSISVPSTNSQDLGIQYAQEVTAIFNGSGSADQWYGLALDVENAGVGTINDMYGIDLTVLNFGTTGAVYGLKIEDMSGFGATASPLSYPLWIDERGVFRIRADNTFNSVYQAIPALYNPQFDKYTPGAANHERIVLGQWSSDVAQIGTEKGGTGTLRAMDFIGASVGFPLSATNGQNFAIKILTELTTIAAAATTDTAIQIPANAVVFGVDVRVTVAIPTAATFTVIGAGSATVFNTAAVTVAANSTDKGTKSCPFYNATAQAIRITPDIQPGANSGRVRVTIHYYEVTAATS